MKIILYRKLFHFLYPYLNIPICIPLSLTLRACLRFVLHNHIPMDCYLTLWKHHVHNGRGERKKKLKLPQVVCMRRNVCESCELGLGNLHKNWRWFSVWTFWGNPFNVFVTKNIKTKNFHSAPVHCTVLIACSVHYISHM